MTDTMSVLEFWDRMDTAVKSKGLTYVTLAFQCDISLPKLYNNRSRHRYPNTNDLIRISQSLDVSLDWLIFGKEGNSNLSESEIQSVHDYLNAPKAVKDIVDRILRGKK